MTSEYSIELQAENINNIKTKQYFQEVLSSYINGNSTRSHALRGNAYER